MGSLILYNYFRSSTSYRVRLALHMKELDFEYRPVNLLKGEQHSSDYRAINPLGGVPSLVHNGKIIPDSVAIIEYINEVFPGPTFFPNDPYLKARIRQTCEVINAYMHPMGNLRTLKYMEQHHGYSQGQKDEWVNHWGTIGLETLETTLKEFSGTYSFGEQITMTDLFLIPQLLTCQRYKMDISKYSTLVKINENCLKLKAFQQAHPFKQIDTPEEFKK